MFTDIDVQKIGEFHDICLATECWAKLAAPQFSAGPWKYIEFNHRYNCLLWDEEDLARRKNVPDSEIATNKRAIDGYNQKRNDAIENIDDLLLQRTAQITPAKGAWLSSETAGSMIDRLSIASLKIFHMGLQIKREDVGSAHIEACKKKLSQLAAQRSDLQKCLHDLLSAIENGQAYYKIYRQFKMYNDATLNPHLYENKNKV